MLAMPEEPRLKRLGERLRDLREKRGETTGRKIYQRDAAKILEVKEDTYRSYEYGRSQLPEKLAKKLAAEWNVDWQEFYRTGKGTLKLPEGSDEAGNPRGTAPEGEVPIPYVGGIAASSKVDWTDPLEAEDAEFVPSDMVRKGTFCCKVVGDSMYGFLWPDDIAIFQATSEEKLGRVVIHRAKDHRVTIKQLKHNGSGWVLHPLNPSYEDEPATGTIVGHLIGIVREIEGTKLTIRNMKGLMPKALDMLL